MCFKCAKMLSVLFVVDTKYHVSNMEKLSFRNQLLVDSRWDKSPRKTSKETLLKLHYIMQYHKQGVYQLQCVVFDIL